MLLFTIISYYFRVLDIALDDFGTRLIFGKDVFDHFHQTSSNTDRLTFRL
jgi:hypothetical protein